jgi:hypothetical protein
MPKSETPTFVVPAKIDKDQEPVPALISDTKDEKSASTSEEETATPADVSGSSKYIIFGLILVGAAFAYFGFRPQKVLPPR